MMTSFIKTLLLAQCCIAGNAYAECTVPSGGDAGLSVTLAQGIVLGKLTVPDTGQSAVIGLNATNGTRTIPSNININSNNSSNHGDAYQVAELTIQGAPECRFRIDVGGLPARISNVNLQGQDGTLLNSSGSGAIGTLSSSGEAVVQVGANITIYSTDTNAIAENIPITVVFIP